MQNIYFTADTHLNHKNILLFRHGYDNVDQMNESIVETWNQVVKNKHDKVYHLGDVALGAYEPARKLLDRLNGTIFLVKGNHEGVAEHKVVRDRFEWIKDYHWLRVGDQKIALCHYAFRVWNCSHHGSWNLHGHSHGTLRDDPSLLQIDVGWDVWRQPIHYDAVEFVMSTKTWKPVDHHKKETK